MSSSSSPCAACKFLRRKCTQECVFAPYFPPDNPQKFANVHKVFGASNVSKLLNELSASQREDAVNSLAYEAEFRLRDPVYGCVGLISILQQKLKDVQADLLNAKKELATFIGPTAMLPAFQHPPTAYLHPHQANPSPSPIPFNAPPGTMLGLQAAGPSHGNPLMIRDPRQMMDAQHSHHQAQHQMMDAQQLAAMVAAREQEVARGYEQLQQLQHQQQQPQHEFMRYNNVVFDPTETVTASGFNQMSGGAMSPSLALGGPYENPYQIHQQQPQQQEHPHNHHHLQFQSQLLLQPQQQQPPQPQQQQRSGSEEGRSVGPS
ncbi:LOB domain-containing protein 36 [Malania oleifera]|uniref:LOB domain-containing protein 36 n=1 Tax=Malania oleifera TaxID=397392 RepID=UPI0025AE9AB3|nr:LOB domain-containing protein 36 [Malania oleifera]XP_057975543.1 LOB domain-containing protein 36 [Malania oleifera]